jgi:two-component system chemotaxis response regulator CheB
MPTHDIIVLGASAGGVEALTRLVHDLPANLPASLFVVLHMAPNVPSLLPAILDRSGPLRAVQPRDGDPILTGHIYCAIPNYHLLIRDGRVRLSRGPRENAHRPAIDPLFRSAAIQFGPRVVGVVLSGNLDDGTAGLNAIKRQNGIAIAQNPHEALFPSMPLSAIENVNVDHILHLKDIPAELIRLAHTPIDVSPATIPPELLKEVEIAAMNPPPGLIEDHPGTPSALSCPECNGTLFEVQDGQLIRYRCRVGHAFSIDSLLTEQSAAVEDALWNAVVALKEKAVGIRKMLAYARKRGHDLAASRFEQHAKDAELQASHIQSLLEQRAATATPPTTVKDPHTN